MEMEVPFDGLLVVSIIIPLYFLNIFMAGWCKEVKHQHPYPSSKAVSTLNESSPISNNPSRKTGLDQ